MQIIKGKGNVQEIFKLHRGFSINGDFQNILSVYANSTGAQNIDSYTPIRATYAPPVFCKFKNVNNETFQNSYG
jgi:hypothetical protein